MPNMKKKQKKIQKIREEEDMEPFKYPCIEEDFFEDIFNTMIRNRSGVLSEKEIREYQKKYAPHYDDFEKDIQYINDARKDLIATLKKETKWSSSRIEQTAKKYFPYEMLFKYRY